MDRRIEYNGWYSQIRLMDIYLKPQSIPVILVMHSDPAAGKSSIRVRPAAFAETANKRRWRDLQILCVRDERRRDVRMPSVKGDLAVVVDRAIWSTVSSSSMVVAHRALRNQMFRNTLMSTSDAVLLFDAGAGQVSLELSSFRGGHLN